MPQRTLQSLHLDLTTSKIESLQPVSSHSHCLTPPSPTRQRSQTNTADPIRISALPNSHSLLSGPGLSPPPPNRFRLLPKKAPVHLFGHQRSQSAPTSRSERIRSVSGPAAGVRKVSSASDHQISTRSLPHFTQVPVILVTASPDLPKRKVTPQSPLHLRVHRRRHGPKQLRDRDHSHRSLRDSSPGGLCHLGRPKSRQHLRQEGARNGGGLGGRLMQQQHSPSPASVTNNNKYLQPRMTITAPEASSRDDRSLPPPPLPARNPRRRVKQSNPSDANTVSQDSVRDPSDLHRSSAQPYSSMMPPTPPATPPLKPLTIRKQTRSTLQAVGTVAITKAVSINVRPLTPPMFSHEERDNGRRTTSGKMRWEDDRDSWF